VLPPPASGTERHDAVWQSTDTLLEELLISAQQCAKLARPVDQDDGSIKSMAQLETSIYGMTSAYRLQAIAAAITHVGDAAVSDESSGSVVTDLGSIVARCIPFLHQFLATCRKGVWHLARNVRSLYRLDYVLVNLFRTLAEKGFCKPSEAGDDDSKGGEGKEIEGMGLGAGTGKSNVSNEIEDESQVEGLKDEDQGEDEDDNGEKQEKEDQAIEMGDDFEGALSDADGEDEDEDGEDDDDGQDENDLDEHVGDVDPEAVDDKFWGDENEEEDQGKDDKTDRKDPNQNQDSEMAAKEDEDKKTGKDNAPEPDRSEETEDAAPEVKEPDNGQGAEDGSEDGDDGQDDAQDEPSKDVDAHVLEAEILDLPEGMDLDQDSQDGDLGEEDGDVGSEMEDDEPNPDDAQSEAESDTADANAAGSDIGEEKTEDHDQVDAGPDKDSAPEQGENEQGQGQTGARDVGMQGEAEDSGAADAGQSEDQTETKDGAQREPQSEKS
jgi:midasin